MELIHEIVRQQLLLSARRHGSIPLALLPSRIDLKRLRYQDVKPMLTYDQLPDEVGLSTEMMSVATFNQGNYGTCQTVCWVAYLKALQALLGGYCPVGGYSPRFNYEIMKALQPASEASNSGGSIQESLETGQKYGVVPETAYPYSGLATDTNNPMPAAAILAQASHKLGTAYPILAETDTNRSSLIPALMNAIYYKKGLLFGVIVCPNFVEPTLQSNGTYLIPLPSGAIEGAHGIFIDQYTKTVGGSVLFAGQIWNSWGPDWPAPGLQGRATLDPAWLEATYPTENGSTAYYLMEAWTCDDGVTMIVMTVGDIEALVNDTTVTLDQAPIDDAETGRVLVPIRFVAEQLGATVSSSALPTISITWGKNTLTLTIGSTTAYLNEVAVTLDQAPYIDAMTGRTLVPVRFIAETMGCVVTWEKSEQQVIIVL
jgi:hypothetical protein